jgi:NADH dehydrogenase
MQQGHYAARLVEARLAGKSLPPFRYRDKGTMATIGSMKAVCDIFGWRYAGPLAWFTWLFVHLMLLVQFENRLLVLVQWAWHYITRNRSARLITGYDEFQISKDVRSPRSG